MVDKINSGIQFSIGNLSVPFLLDAWGSPMSRILQKMQLVHELVPKWIASGGKQDEIAPLGQKLDEYMKARNLKEAEETADKILSKLKDSGFQFDAEKMLKVIFYEAHKKELNSFLETTKRVSAGGVEDYIGWAVVEPKEGQWNWDIYRENAKAIKSRGYKYIPYGWIQNLPHWVRNNPDYTRTSCVEHGEEPEVLSIFASKTKEAYNRFHEQLKKELGTEIDVLRFGSPFDYGETAYPAGAGNWAFPLKHVHWGFWVNEPEARLHFKGTMKEKYKSIENANKVWNTDFNSFEAVDYPKDNKNSRYWLDFVNWYHDALTEKTGELLYIVQKHFPTTPININLGWPFEKICLGQDITGLIKMAASQNIYLRGPTGPIVPFLYTKRVATAVRHYQLPGFSSEPVDENAPRHEIALALFKDLTTGVTWHFDYAPNMERGKDLFDCYRQLWKGKYPEIDTAIFFSATSHRLDNWDNWKEGFTGGYPEGLMPFAERLRDILDYDVVDERLIEDNALTKYSILIWPFGDTVESKTLTKIRYWIGEGGILLIKDLSKIKIVEDDKGAFDDLKRLPRENGMIRVGKGYVFDGKGDLEKVMQLVLNRANPKNIDDRYPRQLTFLPPLDLRFDEVLISQFDDGILLFNKTEKTIHKELSLPDGSWKINYKNLPKSIELPPLAMRWVNGKTGEVCGQS